MDPIINKILENVELYFKLKLQYNYYKNIYNIFALIFLSLQKS
jgi:hypothetical protein